MSKRELLLAALRGERPSTIPVGFWGHNYARENSAADLAAETIEIATRYDWDFVKVQNRFTCFSECWGGAWRLSGRPTVRPVMVAPAVRDAADLERIAATRPDLAPLQEQLEALRLIRSGLPDDRLILVTVFSPLMVLGYSFPEASETSEPKRTALAALREDPARAARVLAAIAETITWFARASIEAGADGIFYATNMTGGDLATVDDVRRFEHPFSRAVLETVRAAPFTVLHICGERIPFDEFADYPATCFSWAIGNGNPGLAEGRTRTGRAVAGGIGTKQSLRGMSPSDAAAEARAAIAATGGAGLLLAPGCSIDHETPPANLVAVRAVARGA